MMVVPMMVMPVMMAVAVIADIPMVVPWVAVIINRRRDHYRRRANRRDWRAHGRRSRDDHRRDGDRNSNVNAKRYAGPRRGGACGCEGDCDCTDENYLFHSYQFDGLFNPLFIARISVELPVYERLASARHPYE